MKAFAVLLMAIGTVLLLVVLVWGRSGVYESQMGGFITLGVIGVAAAFIGAMIGKGLSKEEDANKAVNWRPKDTLQSAGETQALPTDVSDSGEMMNCPNCGTLTRVGAGFCGNCGAKLAVTPPQLAPNLAPPPPPPTNAPQPPPPPPTLPPAVSPPAVPQPAEGPEATPTEPGEPTVVDAPNSPALITLPPGLVSAPPSAPPPPPTTPAPSVADAVFITSPGIPMGASPEEDLDATRISTRRRGGSPWRLVLPNGQHYVVDGAVLVGRDAATNDKWPGAKLLSVQDTTKSVSKTHAVIEADSGGLWVTDLGSTNGVVVTTPDGQELDGDDGSRLRVEPGSDIELGDYIIQVEKD